MTSVIGHGFDGRLHALDVSSVIGAENINHFGKTAFELILVIRDVGCKIGIRTIGLYQRSINIVAKRGGAEQGLLAILVVLNWPTLWRWQTAFVNVAFGTEVVDGLGDSVVSGLDQRSLRKKDVMFYAERS